MIYDAERRDISIALGGDAMITRRMQAFQEERFLKLVEVLRAADVSLVNLEMLFPRLREQLAVEQRHLYPLRPAQPGRAEVDGH